MSNDLSYNDLKKQFAELKRQNEAFHNKQLLFSSALNTISELIAGKERPEDLLESVNQILGKTLQLDRILIYHISFKNNQIEGLCEWLKAENPDISPTKDVYPLDLFKQSYKHFISTQKYIESHLNNMHECFLKEGSGKILHEDMNIKSLLWYPFDFDKNDFYLFALNQVSEIRQWSLDEISFVGTVAKQVSLALMKIKLYEERKVIEKNELKLKTLNANKDRFISILGHDLKGPLGTLLGFSDLLLKNLHNYDIQKIEKQLQVINKTAHQTYGLLDQILLWTKSQSDSLTVEFSDFNFIEVTNNVIKPFLNQANKKNIKINLIEYEKGAITSDLNIYQAVMRNLISNAIKFTNQNGQIDIYAEKDRENVLIIVSDNGIGIDKNKISKLWDEDENYSTTGTNNEKGTGLGLKLCKELIEKQGGEIRVESELGKGSKFEFTIPLQRV